MKADPAVQRRLLDLAAVDAELARVTHRRRTLPEIAEIAEAEQQVRTKQDALVAVETTLGDLDRGSAAWSRQSPRSTRSAPARSATAS